MNNKKCLDKNEYSIKLPTASAVINVVQILQLIMLTSSFLEPILEKVYATMIYTFLSEKEWSVMLNTLHHHYLSYYFMSWKKYYSSFTFQMLFFHNEFLLKISNLLMNSIIFLFYSSIYSYTVSDVELINN